MPFTSWSLAVSLLVTGLFARAAEPVLRVTTAATNATNLAQNGGFEVVQGGRLGGWQAAPDGYGTAPGGGRDGSQALSCEAASETGWRGASQTIVLNRTSVAPLIVSGWSKAEAVTGGRDAGYALYVDLIYQDGTPLWGQTANFATGTHDWERREVTILPDQPVRSLTLHCLFRGHAGRVWFDEVTVNEPAAADGALLFQGTPMELVTANPLPPAPRTRFETPDGLGLELSDTRVVSVQVRDRKLAGPVPGGFLVRDVASGSDVYAFANGQCPELALGLETRFTTRPDHILIEGQIKSTRTHDRAVLLLFALPVELEAWRWGDDIRRERTITGRGEYMNVNAVPCGTVGGLSVYPLAAVHDDATGLAVGLDMAQPAQYRLVAHAGTKQLFIAFDFALVAETERFPGAAPFRFVVFHFDAAGGFRAAWEKYMHIFPDHFKVRSRDQGIWMPFTDVSTVQGWQDFGFRYHEGNNNVAWDDAHGVLSFRYTEPMTWWMPMEPTLPRTEAEALRVRDEYAAATSGSHRQMANVSRSAAMFDADGHPALLFRNEPWANGAVWSLNPNPYLPASPNAATAHWNAQIRDRAYGPGVTPRLDGEYLDSLEGYVTAELNFRREHFRWSTVPLTFASDTRQPALFKGLAIHEFTRWISDDVHRVDGLMFANGVPYRFGFLCPWLDVLGTETDWFPGGQFQPGSAAQLSLWRTLSGGKPYLLLLNTDYSRLSADLVEKYFQRSLAYGFFPSMFSHNAAENPYWRNPTWYNRDRAVFKKYMPLIKQVAEAGWQPLTRGRFSDPAIRVERFGPGQNGDTFFTLLNETAEHRTGVLRLDGANLPGRASERISGAELAPKDNGWELSLLPGSTLCVQVPASPRFVRVEPSGKDGLRLEIATAAGWAQTLETSTDLREWLAVESFTPETASGVLEEPRHSAVASQFYRIRW